MKKYRLLLIICLSTLFVSAQKNLFIFRNNTSINSFLVQDIDSIKFSSYQNTMDIYKSDNSVAKITISSVDSVNFSDNNLATVETVSATFDYHTGKATCVVNVKSNGGCSLLNRGICWSTKRSPTINDRKSTGGTSTGQFYIQTGVLSVDSTYYLRSFTTNCVGTSYGNELVVNSGNVSYTLAIDPVAFPTEYKLIKQAMDSACFYYNRYTTFKGNIYVYYNAGIPTAQASYHGSIEFGPNSSYMWVGTAMHEMAHFMGSGTTDAWKAKLSGGVWTGTKAISVINSFNTGEVLKGDGTHFWPYGINYRNEVNSAEDLICHSKLVQAMVVDDAKLPNSW
ncbi:MAG: hypothetical protein ACYC2P_12215 [Paludibacteraceae bacterium]